MSEGNGCAEAICAICCVGVCESLAVWCNTKAFGGNGCPCCRSPRGCCPNLGGFDDDTSDHPVETRRRRKKLAKPAAKDSSTQMEPSPPMQVSKPAETEQVAEPEPHVKENPDNDK